MSADPNVVVRVVLVGVQIEHDTIPKHTLLRIIDTCIAK